MRPAGVGVKVCGLTRAEDAALAARSGAAALGVVFAPSSRQVDPVRAAEVFRGVPGHVARVGVFVDPEPGLVAEAVARCGLDWVQLSGMESAEQAVEIAREAQKAVAGATERQFTPRMLKAVHVHSADDLLAAADYPADAFLLDAPPADGLMGGTGRRFDWRAAAMVPWHRMRVVLGGGLTAANVSAAMAVVRPGAVDVCSGVEAAPGIKDPVRLTAFLAAVRRAGIGPAPDGGGGVVFLDLGHEPR